MGFCTLQVRAECPGCGAVADLEVQFEYANTRSHVYGLGSKIDWFRPDVGDPSETHVAADGMSVCGSCEKEIHFDIVIRDHVICSIGLHRSEIDYHHGEGFYVILD